MASPDRIKLGKTIRKLRIAKGWTQEQLADVAKLHSTYIGGREIHLINTGEDRATGIAVDLSGNAYVTGWTNSASFPRSFSARRTTCCGAMSGHTPSATKPNPGRS